VRGKRNSSTAAFGREGQKTISKAVKRILSDRKSEKFNSLEVTRVVSKHFLGLSYATVSFHKRNNQAGMFLLGSKDSSGEKDALPDAA
jgi:hypothetical protein